MQPILAERMLLLPSSSGEVEVDVTEWYQRLPQEAIAIATSGRNYDEHASYATEPPSRFYSSTAAARVQRAGRPAHGPMPERKV